MSKIFLYLLLLIIIYSCINNNIDEKNEEITTLENVLTIVDSISLNYPDSLFPSGIINIAFIKDNLYVLNFGQNIKYPIIKFNKNGDFLRVVGRMGGGPEEFQNKLSEICSNNKYLLAREWALNGMYLLKDDIIVNKMIMPHDSCFISGIEFLNENKILCVSKGSSSNNNKHLFFVLNEDMNIINSFNIFPKNAELVTYGSPLGFKGLSKSGNFFIAHHGYPPYIYKITEKGNSLSIDTVYKHIDFIHFKYCDNPNELKEKYNNQRISPIKFNNSFSSISMLYKEKGYIFGSYRKKENDNKKASLDMYYFVLKGGKLIFEKKIKDLKKMRLFTYEDGIVRSYYYKEKNILKVKLYFLKINTDYLDTL